LPLRHGGLDRRARALPARPRDARLEAREQVPVRLLDRLPARGAVRPAVGRRRRPRRRRPPRPRRAVAAPRAEARGLPARAGPDGRVPGQARGLPPAPAAGLRPERVRAGAPRRGQGPAGERAGGDDVGHEPRAGDAVYHRARVRRPRLRPLRLARGGGRRLRERRRAGARREPPDPPRRGRGRGGPAAAARRARRAARDHADEHVHAADPLPHRRRRRTRRGRGRRGAVAAPQGRDGPRHRRLPHPRRTPGLRRLLHAPVLRARLGGAVPGRAGGLGQAARAAGAAPRHGPGARRLRTGRAGAGVPPRDGRRVRGPVRGRRRDPREPHRQAALHRVAGGGGRMTTQARAALPGPHAAPAGAALTTRLLGATVAVYIVSTLLLGNVPGLSRVPHVAVVAAFALLLLRSTQEPLRLRLDAALPVGALFVAYACASVLWSFEQSAALVAAVGLAFDFVGAVVVWAAMQNGVSLRLVALASAAAAAVQGGIALYQYATLGEERAVGLTGNANSLAIQLSLAAFLLLLALPRDRWA